VPTNSRALHAFRHAVAEYWQRSLRRRSQKDGMTWERFTRLANDWRAYRSTRHAATADPEQPRTLSHACPCCGGRMIIIET
jgi:hypothetical protein